MKIIFNLLVLFVGLNSLHSQTTPPGIPYQAIARNANGTPYVNANLTVRFSLHEQNATGTVSYAETKSLQTNDLGLFSTTFGSGTPITGTFAGINWAQTSKFLQVEINLGSTWVDMGTQQLMSVPYALFSAESGSVTNKPSSIFHYLPDGLNNASNISHVIIPPQNCIIEGCVINPYTVPTGKNLYATKITFSSSLRFCGAGVYANGSPIYLQDGAGGACGQITSNDFYYLIGENMTVDVNLGCVGNNSGSQGGGCTYREVILEGFLVDKNVQVVFQNTNYIVPNGFTFVKFGGTLKPNFYFPGQTVPANTNGFLVPN